MGKRKIELDKNVFNYETKLLFLDSIDNHSSVKAYKSLLLQMAKYEKEIDKDFYDMSINEAKSCIDTLTRTTLNASSTLLSKLSYYLIWANSNNMTDNSELLSWIKTLKGEDIVSKVAMESQYYTKDDIYNIAKLSNNAQNEALIILLFYGVEGIELSELRYLKKSDVDFENNIVHLTGYSNIKEKSKLYTRDITLTSDEMGVLQDAINQSSYYKVSVDENGKQAEEIIPLFDTEYLFRNVQMSKRKNIYEPVKRAILTDRLREVSKIVNKPIIAGNIIMSGMLYEITQLKKEFEEITNEDYINILKKYNKNVNVSSRISLRDLYKYLLKNNIKVAVQ